MLDSRGDNAGGGYQSAPQGAPMAASGGGAAVATAAAAPTDPMEDDIPF
jgi:hypothetical protein